MVKLCAHHNACGCKTAEAGLGAPQMVVMSDTDDPFVPLPDDLLVNLAESRGVFEGLLDAIPATFAANSQVGREEPNLMQRSPGGWGML